MIRTTSDLFTEAAVGLPVLLINPFMLEKTVFLSFCFAVELVSIALSLFFWSFYG
jgi:hypothetical protein